MFQFPAGPRNQTRRRTAIQALSALTAIVVLSGIITSPAFAEGQDLRSEGMVSIYTRTGGVIQKKITDEHMLTELLKDATIIPDGGIMMHDGHWYLLKDHKMASGMMAFESIASGH